MSERQLALSPQRLRASGARGPYMYRSASPPRRHRTWTSRENVSCPRTGRSSLRDVAVQRSFSCAPATEAAISPAIFLTSVSNIDPRHRQREGAALRARTGDAAGVVVPPRTGPPAPPPAPQAQNSVPVAAAPLTDANTVRTSPWGSSDRLRMVTVEENRLSRDDAAGAGRAWGSLEQRGLH